MATYHLTVHQLFERLSADDSSVSGVSSVNQNHNHSHAPTPPNDPAPPKKKGHNKRSDSVISWFSNTSNEAEEIDFTDFNAHRSVDAFERIVVGERK